MARTVAPDGEMHVTPVMFARLRPVVAAPPLIGPEDPGWGLGSGSGTAAPPLPAPESSTTPRVVNAPRINQTRQIITDLPGPKSKALDARRTAAVAPGVSSVFPLSIDRAEGAITPHSHLRRAHYAIHRPLATDRAVGCLRTQNARGRTHGASPMCKVGACQPEARVTALMDRWTSNHTYIPPVRVAGKPMAAANSALAVAGLAPTD